ncbi:hypothetical protein AB0M46_02395 [Dactylosporangium sp. NPDC051485]
MNAASVLRRRSGRVRYRPLWLLVLPAAWFVYVLAYVPNLT